MGTWDTGPFDNDTAVDWTYALETSSDLTYIEHTIAQAITLPSDASVSANIAEPVVAAAETLARLLGRGGDSTVYTEVVDAWVAAHQLTPSPELLAQARAALARILQPPSELLDLWGETEESADWVEQVRALSTKLA